MAWSGTTHWSNWNNMLHIKIHSNWTISTVCRYGDNDMSLFFLSFCCDNRRCRLAMCRIHWQRHLVDTAGKLIQQSEARRIIGQTLHWNTCDIWLKKQLTGTLGMLKIHNSKMFPYVMNTLWFVVSWIQRFLDLKNCSLFTMFLVSLDLPFHIRHTGNEGWTAA